jgi:phytol kinase
MARTFVGIGFVLTAFGLLFAALRAARRRFSLHPELTRKLMHLGMGSVTLSVPWWFDDAWPVLSLAALSIAVFIALRKNAALRREFGGVLGGVERRSLGEIYFAIAAAPLFLLARGDALLFVVSMLILTLADVAAALVGVRYGSHRYDARDGGKSLEGSVAFFIVAFFSALLPLQFASDMGSERSLPIACVLGLATTLLEAIARRGLDNLFIPLGSFLLLKACLAMNGWMLTGQLAATILLTAVLAIRSIRRAGVGSNSALPAAHPMFFERYGTTPLHQNRQ